MLAGRETRRTKVRREEEEKGMKVGRGEKGNHARRKRERGRKLGLEERKGEGGREKVTEVVV